MKFAFVAAHRSIWPVAWQCSALGVSRSGFHAWLNRPPSARAVTDEKIAPQVRSSFPASDRTDPLLDSAAKAYVEKNAWPARTEPCDAK